MNFPNFPELRNLSRQRCRSCLWNCWGGLVPHNIQSPVDWCHKELHLRCCGKREVCLCHYPYYYHYFSNWTSFKIHLIWAHLKFHYKLLFHFTSATIPESKFSSSTVSSYLIPLWQCMDAQKDIYAISIRQSFLPPLNYSNSNSLLSVLIAQLRENNLK